ncbi:MAG: hypothetical protein ACP5LS_01630 [Thermoprotei archaeon]
MPFNLLASCPRGKEPMAKSELAYFLAELGDGNPTISRTKFSGLLEVSTSLDPFEVVSKAKEEALSNPWNFRYVTKLVPIAKVVRSDLNEIVSAVKEIANGLSNCESFRVTLVKRGTSLNGDEIVHQVASMFSLRVSLENPSCVILIEVVGEFTGIAILRKPVFSLQRIINGSENITKIRISSRSFFPSSKAIIQKASMGAAKSKYATVDLESSTSEVPRFKVLHAKI